MKLSKQFELNPAVKDALTIILATMTPKELTELSLEMLGPLGTSVSPKDRTHYRNSLGGCGCYGRAHFSYETPLGYTLELSVSHPNNLCTRDLALQWGQQGLELTALDFHCFMGKQDKRSCTVAEPTRQLDTTDAARVQEILRIDRFNLDSNV